MSEKRIEELIVRFIEGTCPDQEIRELLDWVRESSENRELLFGMKDLYDRSRLRLHLTEEQIDAGWARIAAECGIGERPVAGIGAAPRTGRMRLWLWSRIGRRGLSIAAAIAVVLGVAVSSYVTRSEEFVVVTNAQGTQDHLVLPDGSGVWLYYGASIGYPKRFGKNRRDVKLTGEAFFDVVPDRTSPFVVETKLLKVEVLGTRFNLLASDERAQVVLESGSVNLGRMEQGRVVRQVLLRPGEVADVSSSDDAITVGEADLQAALSWKDKYLVAKSMRMEDLVRMLAKTYHTSIVIDDAALRDERISGRFDQRQPIEEIFGIIDLIMPIRYEYDGVRWIVSPVN